MEVDDYGVHDTHCCRLHGCKYGDDDCPVVLGTAKGVRCESCDQNESNQELFACVAEEAGEVTQIIGKILRFGLFSSHPDDPQKITNNIHLARELADILVLIDILAYEGIINRDVLSEGKKIKHARLEKYLRSCYLDDDSKDYATEVRKK